jgi:hypothetical protein
MSNDGPKKPINTYEQMQGLYYSLPINTRESLGKKFTKAVSEREHVSGLKSLNSTQSRPALAGIPEVDEETEAAATPKSTYSTPTPK